MKRILCIGEGLVDLVAKDSGNEYFERRVRTAPVNVAATVGKLCGEVKFLGQVGDDDFGKYFIEKLNEHRISTSFIKIQGKTSLLTICEEKGNRSINFYRDSGSEYEIDLNELNISENDIVHFGSATAFLNGIFRESNYRLLEKVKRKKAFISFDPNYRKAFIKDKYLEEYKEGCFKFMKLANFIKLSRGEVFLLTGAETLFEGISILKSRFKAIIVVTLGKEGAMLIEKGICRIVKSIDIEFKDKSIAGDAFVGAVLVGASGKYKNFNEIIKFANIVAALTCTKVGGTDTIPNLEELEFCLNENRKKIINV